MTEVRPRTYPMCLAFLLAQDPTRLESMTSHFRHDGRELQGGDVRIGLFLIASVALGIFFVIVLSKYLERRQARPRPLALFRSLCRAHRLTWGDSWLLYRVAWSQRLADPGCVFLERHRFERETLVPELQVHATRLKALAERLFSENNEEPAATDSRRPEPSLPESVSDVSSARREEPCEAAEETPEGSPLVSAPMTDEAPWPPLNVDESDAPFS